MKRFITFIIVTITMMFPVNLFAQTVEGGSPYKIWTNPVVYRATDQVTWYFDMTDTKFKAGEDLYMWTWAPSEPDAGNWENSSDFAKLKYEGENIYSFTIVPTEYYGVDADIMNANHDIYWGRLKTQNGSMQSDVFQVPTSHLDYEGFLASGNAVQAFPEKFAMKEPLSILVDISKFVFNGVEGGLKNTEWTSIHMHSGLDNWTVLQEAQMWLPEIVEKTKLDHVEGDIYRMDMVPMLYYGVESDYEAENITWLITTYLNPDVNWTGTGDGPVLKAAAAAPYPDPAFSYFPSKFSSLDILTITRKYNGKTDGDLTYTITAGGKTIIGTMPGSRDKREANINLLDELAGVDATSIHLTITNNNGITVVDTELPLVPLSEITIE